MEFSKEVWNLTDYEMEYDAGIGEAFRLKDFTVKALSNGLPDAALFANSLFWKQKISRFKDK
ncbi:hypothetical protein M2451_001129 [Dysgonomonas sp. PFB1-18]|uniref:hypothetical protein n=1 Tax=unclassified Dysgonomonas TaxID=2630389 RepID=UPI002476D355|nr:MULTISPECIES: hypothetical protein [unclassified Dysgonomonas]MDH6308246.1 hypothetical protein [Dysgonomonas sp. PF1-14]MDH6338315.1 hypothetical protein [Dysgonomonas sp. PF1-16]MDH6379812.1 hypothetical protein [Dysgonomonas sp. PFB1-18]MDH6397098.1 hypothetical protein [Dysgonomonas sp. PF1-23]